MSGDVSQTLFCEENIARVPAKLQTASHCEGSRASDSDDSRDANGPFLGARGCTNGLQVDCTVTSDATAALTMRTRPPLPPARAGTPREGPVTPSTLYRPCRHAPGPRARAQ
ncbi:hypothetical protein NDU88_000965 [Pleurodeles waltl]|uniref:Uncharacterized protein n=1 Tax=Pleurodeles waltl TaxID=8319 RepID=A0AAV7WKE9_PLEWA|nr:hypothetical protein NDU88_000965 [Pleurodeles waltl]